MTNTILPKIPYVVGEHIRMARESLACARFIAAFPSKNGKKVFDSESGSVDSFYRCIANFYFNDAVLLICSLIDTDKQTISFYSWDEFKSKEAQWLFENSPLTKKERESSTPPRSIAVETLKTLRDKIIAHRDKMPFNAFPRSRKIATLDVSALDELQVFLDVISEKYCSFRNQEPGQNGGYKVEEYFKVSSALLEIEHVMNAIPPKLTNNTMI